MVTVIWRKKGLYSSKVSTTSPQILCLKRPASTYHAAVYEPSLMSKPVSLNHQTTRFSGNACMCSLWKGHMTSVGLRKSKKVRSPQTDLISHTLLHSPPDRNTLNTSRDWAIMTPANQSSSPNWIATDLPQPERNSFQHTAECFLLQLSTSNLFVSWHASSFYALWKSALSHRSSHQPNSGMTQVAPLCFISPASEII